MALFSPFSGDLFQPLQPFFQMLDHDTFAPVCPVRQISRGSGNGTGQAKNVASFVPRFDVRESKDAYHLDGELPGLAQKDVELSFSDPHTLLVKGKVVCEYQSSNQEKEPPKSAAIANATEEDALGQQPQKVVQRSATSTSVAKTQDKPEFKYWVSERSSGSFHRTFNFPVRVDPDHVRASLKDGILSVTVPKAPTPTLKKIEVTN
ncbi:hypothetical protein KEM52_005406 [Ascosphaera acerosa]|nr:hypothetical protein KEM52_005406 [Ascosphaera acerosa]